MKKTKLRKRKGLSRRSKGTIGTLKEKLWIVFSVYIRNRDKKCVTCGGGAENAGHYIHNTERLSCYGGNELWYSEQNINAQCVRCNKWKSGNLTKYAEYLESVYGQGILQELRKKYLLPKKWKREELQELLERYKNLNE